MNTTTDDDESIDVDDHEDNDDTIISSLSSNTPALSQVQEISTINNVEPLPPPAQAEREIRTTPAFGMKAVYARNEEAAEAGAAAAARDELDEQRQQTDAIQAASASAAVNTSSAVFPDPDLVVAGISTDDVDLSTSNDNNVNEDISPVVPIGADLDAEISTDHVDRSTANENDVSTDTPPVLPILRMPSSSWDDEEPYTDDATASFTTPPQTKLVSQQSTPGAVSVPGISASTDDDEHDNLLDEESSDVFPTMTSQSGPPHPAPDQSQEQLPETPARTTFSVESTSQGFSTNTSHSSPYYFPTTFSDDETPIIAELATSTSSSIFDQQDVEDRLAQRLEAQMNERLRQEMDRRLSQERQSHVLAHVVSTSTPQKDLEQPSVSCNYSNDTSPTATGAIIDVDDEENFKVCGIRRTCWGMILCVIMLFIIGGVVGLILWFADNRNSSGQPTGGITSPPSTTAPTVPLTSAPTTGPTRPLADRRRDHLLEEIGLAVVPSNTDPEEYFADESTPQYAALEWMSTLDLETNVFETPAQILMERYVLAVLYYSTGGNTTWIESYDFLSSTSFCEWNDAEGDSFSSTENRGISCSNGPLVTSIVLPGNGIEGQVPWEISLLEYLIEMVFDKNALTGTIPAEFGALTWLQSMWFKSNTLTGSLPPQLANATSLASIDLEDNGISSYLPTEWGSSLPDLFYVGLRLNEIGGTLPRSWQQLSSLRVLDLEGNQMDGQLPRVYGQLTELSSLYLENNRFQGFLPSEYGDLTKLQNFFVFGNRLSGTVPSQYSRLSNLDYFWFQNNDLTGSVNDIFCILPFVDDLRGDCLSNGNGLAPQINCTCCTSCCDSDGLNCVDMT